MSHGSLNLSQRLCLLLVLVLESLPDNVMIREKYKEKVNNQYFLKILWKQEQSLINSDLNAEIIQSISCWFQFSKLNLNSSSRRGRGCSTWRTSPPGDRGRRRGNNISNILRKHSPLCDLLYAPTHGGSRH